MKAFDVMKTLVIAMLVAATFVACDEESDPITPDPEVAAPTNLTAASADAAVWLSWTASADVNEDNFGGYMLSILNTSTNQQHSNPIPIGAGLTSVRIDGLTNGVRYIFTLRSVTDLGNESTNYASVEWSPAVQQTQDAGGNLIKVYATTSNSFPSAIDLYNDAGLAEVISQAGTEFTERGDLYVFASSSSSTLSLKSPAEANNQGLETQFSNASPVDVDDLADQLASEPPANSTYTQKELTLDNGAVTSGRVYWGRLVRGNEYFYFRLLLKKGSNGKLVQGDGNDRYVEMNVSFQNAPNNPFAKH